MLPQRDTSLYNQACDRCRFRASGENSGEPHPASAAGPQCNFDQVPINGVVRFVNGQFRGAPKDLFALRTS